MPKRKFAKGDRVTVLSAGTKEFVPDGIYTIVQVMPDSGLGYQYRVKSRLEIHERIVSEYILHPAN